MHNVTFIAPTMGIKLKPNAQAVAQLSTVNPNPPPNFDDIRLRGLTALIRSYKAYLRVEQDFILVKEALDQCNAKIKPLDYNTQETDPKNQKLIEDSFRLVHALLQLRTQLKLLKANYLTHKADLERRVPGLSFEPSIEI